jgi:hypothetical protein
VVVAVILVRPVQPPADEVVDVIAVRNRFVLALVAVRVVALGWGGVPAGMCLIDRDHVLVDVVLVRVMQVPVVHVVDVVVVAHGGVPAVRSMLVSVCAFMDLVGHTPTLERRVCLCKRWSRSRKRRTPRARSRFGTAMFQSCDDCALFRFRPSV